MNSFVFIVIFCALSQSFVNSKLIKREVLENANSQVEDGDLVKPVQKIKGFTEMATPVEFEYEWIIKNASLWYNLDKHQGSEKYFKSPLFSIETPIQTYTFFLKFFYKYEYNRYNQNYQNKVELNLESDIDDEILIELNVTLNDGNLFWDSFNFGRNRRSYVNNLGPSQSSTYLSTLMSTDIKILLEGKCIVPIYAPTMITDTYNSNNFLGPKIKLSGLMESDPDQKIIQQLLHVLYTGRASSFMNVEGLLWAGDNVGLKLLLEEKLFSKINTTNAAEIYKFMFVHNKPELKKKAMKFIKQNAEEVMATPGWISILQSANIPMLAEIFSAFVNRPPKFDLQELENVNLGTTEEIYTEN